MLMMIALVRTGVETFPADARLPGPMSKKLCQLMLMMLALAGSLSKLCQLMLVSLARCRKSSPS